MRAERFTCDRCLDPFSEADCHPDCTPEGEDWSEYCISCREFKRKWFDIEAALETEHEELVA